MRHIYHIKFQLDAIHITGTRKALQAHLFPKSKNISDVISRSHTGHTNFKSNDILTKISGICDAYYNVSPRPFLF